MADTTENPATSDDLRTLADELDEQGREDEANTLRALADEMDEDDGDEGDDDDEDGWWPSFADDVETGNAITFQLDDEGNVVNLATWENLADADKGSVAELRDGDGEIVVVAHVTRVRRRAGA